MADSKQLDAELARVAYEIMAMQAAARQQGPGPSYRRQDSLRSRIAEPLPQAQLDWQTDYAHGNAPKEFPGSAGAEGEKTFMDRTIRMLRGMGMTGAQIANFVSRTAASQPGPRLSNREVVATEQESPLGPTTYERGVGFSNQPQKRPTTEDLISEAAGGVIPTPLVGGILAGRKAAERVGGETLKKFTEGGKAAQGGITTDRLWKEFGYGVGSEGKGRWEIPGPVVPPATTEALERAFMLSGSRMTEPAAKIPAAAILDKKVLEAYPEFGKTTVTFNPRTGPTGAGRRGQAYKGDIEFGAGSFRDPGHSLRQMFQHEVQHPIQEIEGHARGANWTYETNMRPSGRGASLLSQADVPTLQTLTRVLKKEYGWDNEDLHRLAPGMVRYLKSAGEVEARNAERRLVRNLYHVPPSKTEDVPRALQWINTAGAEMGIPSQSVKDPGGLWSPLAIDKLQRYLQREGVTPRQAQILSRYGREGTGTAFDAWGARSAKNYLNRFAGTERDPIKDLEVPAHVRNIVREPLQPRDIGRLEGMIERLRNEMRVGGERQPGADEWREREIQKAQRILREGHYTDIAHAIEDRPWDKIMDSVIRSMPFEQFLETVGKNRTAMAKISPDLRREIAKLENAYRAGKFGPNEPVWYLRQQTSLRDFPTDFARRVGHVGATVRGQYGTQEYAQRDFPRAFADTLHHEQAAARAKTAKDLEEVFKGTTTIKEYPDKSRWVEVGKGGTTEEGRTALNKEGSLMGHCVGGYCDAVESGRSRIYSLRDAKGEPHVTIEVNPVGEKKTISHVRLRIALGERTGNTVWDDWNTKYSAYRQRFGFQHQASANDDAVYEKAFDTFLSENHPQALEPFRQHMQSRQIRLSQIKGKQNRPPDEKYLRQVEDFVNQIDSGNYSTIAGIRDVPFKSIHEIGDYTNSPRFRDKIYKELGRKRWYLKKDLDRLNREWIQGKPDERDALDL